MRNFSADFLNIIKRHIFKKPPDGVRLLRKAASAGHDGHQRHAARRRHAGAAIIFMVTAPLIQSE